MSDSTNSAGQGSMRVRVEAATDIGLRRPQNEDFYGCWLPDEPEELRRRGTLLAVADGMGGARGGHIASRLAIETLLGAYRESPGESVTDDLRAAMAAANERVHRESLALPEYGGMGTTCTAVVLREGEIHIAHVGDSRAYLVRNGRIRQITDDHSLVGQMVRDRQLTAEQARTDPRRHVVIRSVGIGPDVEIDAARIGETLMPGDVVLLTTDGLHGLVSDEDLCAAASGPDLVADCRRLIVMARERGGPDNITVVLARAESDSGAPVPEAVPELAAATAMSPRPAATPDTPAGSPAGAGRRGSKLAILAAVLGLLFLVVVLALRLSLRRRVGV